MAVFRCRASGRDRRQSPFQIHVPNHGWQKSLHGFRWLRHMRAAGTELAAANARALVSDWIAIAWQPHFRRRLGAGTTAKRIIAWLQHSSVVLQGAEFPFYRAFLKSLAVQIRYLALDGARNAGRQGAAARPHRAGLCRAVAAGAAVGAARRDPQPGRGARAADPAGRRPYLAQSRWRCWSCLPTSCRCATPMPTRPKPRPTALIGAIDRMLPALRFFRHQDGSARPLQRHGRDHPRPHRRHPAPRRHRRRAAAARPAFRLRAPVDGRHHGHRRHRRGAACRGLAGRPCGLPVLRTVLRPPPLHRQLRDRYLWRRPISARLARATAAHSTATLNDTSSARFSHSARVNGLLGSPLIGRPAARCAPPASMPDDSHGFVASHDGYVAALRPHPRARASPFRGRQSAHRASTVSTVPAANRRATMAATWSRCASTFIPTSSSTATATTGSCWPPAAPTAGASPATRLPRRSRN